MKLLHIADVHLDSPLTSHLPAAKVRERRTQLLGVLRRAIELGVRMGVSGVLIAGDLFDDERVSRRAMRTVLDVIAAYPSLPFYYLGGNHEGEVLKAEGTELSNLHIFTEKMEHYSLGEVDIYGRYGTSRRMFDELSLDPRRKNIVMLHGELRERSTEDGAIGLRDAAGKGIDYLALGHYHKYSEERIDERGVAVYPGTPEGRGFDECGSKGVVILDTDTMTHTFHPLAARVLHDVKVDLTGAQDERQIRRRIEDAAKDASREDMVRVTLVGEVPFSLPRDVGALSGWYAEKYYYFELRDRCTVQIDKDALSYDKSLFGELMRTVEEDEGLSDEERTSILQCAAMALAGEEWIHP